MSKRETQKSKAEQLDRLREIFKDSYLVQINDDTFEELGVFSYNVLSDSSQIGDAILMGEEVAVTFDGEEINEVLSILRER